MNKFKLTIEVDEEQLRGATGDNESSVEFLVEQEMGWVSQSGISVVDMEEIPDDDQYADDLANSIN